MKLEGEINKTLSYFDKFKCYPDQEQLAFCLISPKVYPKEKVIEYLDKKQLKKMYKKDNYLKLKISLAKKLAKQLKKNKNVLLLAITGSVASNYPKKEDDIDLMIITKKNKLWISRIQIKFFLIKNKIAHRKSGKKEEANQFCFNLWLDEIELNLPLKKQNLKNAMDLLLLKPIINKNNTYEKFIFSNSWAKKYVASGYQAIASKINNKNRINYSWSIKDWFWLLTNKILFLIQFRYMKKKLKSELVSINQAFFHPKG